jgi:hypothetical protein
VKSAIGCNSLDTVASFFPVYPEIFLDQSPISGEEERMALHLSWYNPEQTAFLVRYEPGWTWEQHHALIKRIDDQCAERGFTSGVALFDLRGTTLPFNASAGPNYRNPREGSYIVLIIDNMFTRTIAQLIIKARGDERMISIVNTIEDGQTLINDHLAKMVSSNNTSSKP